jgi:aquaporin Z
MANESDVRSRMAGWFRSEFVDPVEDFKNPEQEWRRLFSEAFGTFSWCSSPRVAA